MVFTDLGPAFPVCGGFFQDTSLFPHSKQNELDYSACESHGPWPIWTLDLSQHSDAEGSRILITAVYAQPALAGGGGGQETVHLLHMSMDSLPASRD